MPVWILLLSQPGNHSICHHIKVVISALFCECTHIQFCFFTRGEWLKYIHIINQKRIEKIMLRLIILQRCISQNQGINLSWIIITNTLWEITRPTVPNCCCFNIFLNLFDPAKIKYSAQFHQPWFNPLHSNISMHILFTVSYSFPEVLTRRICFTNKSFFSWWSFPLFLWPCCVIQGWYCEKKLDVGHS